MLLIYHRRYVKEIYVCMIQSEHSLKLNEAATNFESCLLLLKPNRIAILRNTGLVFMVLYGGGGGGGVRRQKGEGVVKWVKLEKKFRHRSCDRRDSFITRCTYRIYPAIRRGFFHCRVTSNN